MAEKNVQFENIKKINTITDENGLPKLLKEIKDSKKSIKEVFNKIEEKENKFAEIKKIELEKALKAEAVAEKILNDSNPVEKVETPLKDTPKVEVKKDDIKEDVKKVETIKSTSKTEPQTEKIEPKAEVKPEVKAEVKPEVKAEVKPEVKAEVKAEVKTEPKAEVKAEVKPEVKTEVKPEPKTEPKAEVKTEVKLEPKAEKSEEKPRSPYNPRPNTNTNDGSRPPYTPRPQYNNDGTRPPYTPRPNTNTNDGSRPPYTPRPAYNNDGTRPPYTPRPAYNNDGTRPPYTPRPAYNNDGTRPPYTPRPAYNNDGTRPPYTPRPPYNNDGTRPPYTPRPPYNNDGTRPPYTPRPAYNNDGTRPPYTPRPPYNNDGTRPPYNNNYGSRPPYNPYNKDKDAPAPVRTAPPKKPGIGGLDALPIKDSVKNFVNKKKVTDKPYEDKKTINKRALIKKQVDVDEFDEDRNVYRKLRQKKQKVQFVPQLIKIEKATLNAEIIPLKVLSEKLGISAVDITKRLFKEGIIKTINDTVDFDTAEFIATDLGIEVELKIEKTAEEVLSEFHVEEKEDNEILVSRPPVVTVMGHVDHGKTSLLDRIRSTNVTTGEAGGITQHIGAYSVTLNGKSITFLDTPGHAAFTSMRARGAQVTDIAILVVAADDGVMPQTIEAINHAKAAKVPIIVAINKMDKPDANIDKIKQQLAENDVVPEDWGGDAILVPVSAKTGFGIDSLLETINLVAEMRDLKANPDRKAKGVIIEAKLDKGKGPIATVIVENGTLRRGDNIVAGTVVGRIRAMIDDKGRAIKEAGPSTAVSILGLEDVPNAGDILLAVEQEKLSKLVAEERKNKVKEEMTKTSGKVTLDDVFNKIAEGHIKGLNLIIKADVQGSVEAVKQSLIKLSNEEVKVNVIHSAAGAITESDIMLADSSNAIVIGFNVRPDTNAKIMAERAGVDVRMYKVIYEAIEDVGKALKGMLEPKFKEVILGKAEVRNVFKLSTAGLVAGSYILDGKITRNSKVRIIRNEVVVGQDDIMALKRFKDDVKDVSAGYECGISLTTFTDIKEGDIFEAYMMEQIKV